ncbi:helix-turn-helix domain-containing protein [Streptomyces boncukensis]|uniref:helix-turn-helix domain-containing protein n=1 Tax=Streptomyces boncukensis TaxID=2711219 RepID=UPI001F4954FA|nr:helix-turn-helix transcriptional regulator [Streptomyces boncukensis]
MAVPTVRRRRLGSELKRIRESAKLTLDDVEEKTGLSASKVSRIEGATRGARPSDVELLLDAYETWDAGLRSFLTVLARDGAKRG